MIALIQRVASASVAIEGDRVAAIDGGIMALVGVELGDDEHTAQRLLERVLTYRIFEDDSGRMNLSLEQTQGGLLLVPQFTLVADTRKGRRPSFSGGPSAEQGSALFSQFVALAKAQHSPVGCGVFGADMLVSLVNDGPVTFWLQVPSTP